MRAYRILVLAAVLAPGGPGGGLRLQRLRVRRLPQRHRRRAHRDRLRTAGRQRARRLLLHRLPRGHHRDPARARTCRRRTAASATRTSRRPTSSTAAAWSASSEAVPDLPGLPRQPPHPAATPTRRSLVHPSNLPATCGTCHEDQDFLERLNIKFKHPIEVYQKGVHGKATAGGKDTAASCNDCHSTGGTAHRILPPGDVESTINFFNISKTCGKCHSTIQAGVRGGHPRRTGRPRRGRRAHLHPLPRRARHPGHRAIRARRSARSAWPRPPARPATTRPS